MGQDLLTQLALWTIELDQIVVDETGSTVLGSNVVAIAAGSTAMRRECSAVGEQYSKSMWQGVDGAAGSSVTGHSAMDEQSDGQAMREQGMQWRAMQRQTVQRTSNATDEQCNGGAMRRQPVCRQPISSMPTIGATMASSATARGEVIPQ